MCATRQRIAIARAFLTDKRLLVMDEPSASLDSTSEKLVQDAVYNLMSDRTVLLIAHRLATVAAADKIACMRDGQVVEEGTHSELVAQDGLYASLVQAQRLSFA